MTKRIVLVTWSLLAGVSGACGTAQPWTKPGVSQEVVDRDRYECTREAAMVPRVPYPTYPVPVTGAGFATGFIDGMNKGQYYAARGAAQASDQRATELFTLCMKTRGYSQDRR